MTTLLATRPKALKKPASKAYQSVNPFNGKILKTFEALTNPQLEKAIKTAATCFEIWRNKSFAERAVVVAKAAGILRARADEFARPMTLEMGKLIAEARGEVALSADILDYYGRVGAGVTPLPSPNRR